MSGDHGDESAGSPIEPAGPAAKRRSSVPRPRHSPEDVKMAQILHRHNLLMAIVDRCGRIGLVAAFAIPLWIMQPMVSDLAGKTTNIDAVMTVSVTVNIALAAGNVIQYSRRRSQGGEIRRQRERTGRLEAQVRQPAEEFVEGER